jgi:CrcB protein
MNLILIAIGGALGSMARYLSSEAIIKICRGTQYVIFPFNTLVVNVAGSLLVGIFYYFAVHHFDLFDHKMRNFWIVGFFGGFTTFSAFSLDFFRLFVAGHEFLAFSYVMASVSLALLSLFFGFYLMKVIFA